MEAKIYIAQQQNVTVVVLMGRQMKLWERSGVHWFVCLMTSGKVMLVSSDTTAVKTNTLTMQEHVWSCLHQLRGEQ